MKLNWHKIALLIIVGAGISLLATGCGSGVVQTIAPTPSPDPTVLGLSPTFAIRGATSQTLTITGTGFQSSSSITYNGSQHPFTLIGSQQLSISLSQSDLATPGDYTVAVTNQAPGGGTASAIFQVWQTLNDSSSGMTFSMPIFGNSTVLTGDATQSKGGQIIPESYSNGSTTPTSGFGFDIDPNVQHLSLLQWFETNVDVNGTLIAAGAYQQQTLTDGSPAIVLGTGSDQAYFDAGGIAPVLETAYKMTSSGYVVSIFTESDPSQSGQGYLSSPENLGALELAVLSTVHF